MKITISPAVLLFAQLGRPSGAFLQPSVRKSCLASTRFAPITATREPSDRDDERYEERGRAEEELRRVKYPGKQDGGSDIAYYDSYDSYDDDDEIVVEDEYLEDEENDGAVVPETGNFWSNPREGMDRDLEVPRRRQRMPPSTAAPRRRPPRGRGSRTTFRSGTPPAPEAFKDMYDKLFWYGVDEDEDNDRVPASYDKTVFGEKRGKFNALSYLEDDYDVRPPPRRIKRKLTQEEGGAEYDDNPNDDYYDVDEDVVRRRDPPRRPRRREAGFDSEDQTPRRQRRGRRDDWVSEDVSEWFGEDDDDEYEYDDESVDSYDDDGYEEDSPRSRRQQRRRRSRTNPIVKFLDGLLDVDREDMSFKEQMYEQKLGRRPRPRTTEPRRRPSYVYDEIDDNFSDAIELEDEKDGEMASEMLDDDGIMDAEIEDEPEEDTEAEKPRMSWEERSRRLELVPPAGIPAWGPSGDLGIDARTKAMLNGMEELRDARAQVEAKEERTKLARDDIVVLRADAALETKKRNSNPRRARERLRQIQLDIEDAARALRRAQKEEELAKARLDMLKDKHWAVLSLYDPNKASQEVAETIAEFSRLEVAAELIDGPGSDSNGPSQQQSDSLSGEERTPS